MHFHMDISRTQFLCRNKVSKKSPVMMIPQTGTDIRELPTFKYDSAWRAYLYCLIAKISLPVSYKLRIGEIFRKFPFCRVATSTGK